MALHEASVRAVRFNLYRNEADQLDYLANMADRVFELAGWHVELYLNGKQLEDLYSKLIALPAVCIDHLGLQKCGLPNLYRLAEEGVHTKATGFGRIDFDAIAVLKQLYAINPDGVMFGTDLPCTRAARPYHEQGYLNTLDILGERGAENVFFNNARRFYKVSRQK